MHLPEMSSAMWAIAIAWESITSAVIQNCFAKCGFGIEDAVVTEEVDQDNSDWVELQGPVDKATLMIF
jgi:hypothetical protein